MKSSHWIRKAGSLISRGPLAVIAAAILSVACNGSPAISVQSMTNPSGEGARLPNLARQDNGIVLSWVDTSNSEPPEYRLRYATLRADQEPIRSDRASWSTVRSIATGQDWFVNWADFPSVYAGANGSLYAHWLVRSGDSTYAYDVTTSSSRDGLTWDPPWVPHLDGTQTEHGFVSFFSQREHVAMVWLDGRNSEPGSHGHEDHAATDQTGKDAPAMSLRTRRLPESTASNDAPMSTLLDARVCDCCQTAAATTESGAVVLYRDRSEAEIRDIAFVHYDSTTQQWSQPQTLHDDGWQITGCPVNGPQADAHANQVAVAWFTASPSPRVLLALSTNGGASFGAPRIVSDVDPVGRVDLVMLSSGDILVSWLEQHDVGRAELTIAWYDDTLALQARTTVSHLNSDRRNGFARMASVNEDAAMIAWTEWLPSPPLDEADTPVEKQSRVNTALLELTGTR